MNRKLWFLPALLFLFIACATKPDAFVPLNYSESDVLRNEISTVNSLLPEKPMEALWRAGLLKANGLANADVAVEIQNIFDKCVAAIAEQCRVAVVSNDYITARRLLSSLAAVGQSGVVDDVAGELLRSSVDTMSLVNKKDVSDGSVSSYISGTVTVWVDLGIQVSKGMGYASHVIGSGFFISDDGYIVTNYHVIQTEVDPEYEGYSRLYIKLASDSDTRIPAKVIGWDPVLDLALLKAEVDAPYSFSLGSSSGLDVGDRIYAIGSPAGLERTLTSGIVSSIDRRLFTIGSVMQIDAAINSGNSGGPIIDEHGNVQAIVFAGMLEYQGLNFAIPVEYLKANLAFFMAGGRRQHGWLGAFGKDIKADEFLSRPAGLEVQYVMPGSSAARAGIQSGDVIIAVDGKTVTGIDSFQGTMLYLLPDTIVDVDILRSDGSSCSVPVLVVERPDYPGYEVYKTDLVSNAFLPIFGMKLVPIDAAGKKFTVSEVLKGSTADESGFSVHDPVDIVKVRLSQENDAMYAQLYTKKRKNGYFEVDILIGASLDSPFYF